MLLFSCPKKERDSCSVGVANTLRHLSLGEQTQTIFVGTRVALSCYVVGAEILGPPFIFSGLHCGEASPQQATCSLVGAQIL